MFGFSLEGTLVFFDLHLKRLRDFFKLFSLEATSDYFWIFLDSQFFVGLLASNLVSPAADGWSQESAMKKAIAIAPRGKRAMELLNISVGHVAARGRGNEKSIISEKWCRYL